MDPTFDNRLGNHGGELPAVCFRLLPLRLGDLTCVWKPFFFRFPLFFYLSLFLFFLIVFFSCLFSIVFFLLSFFYCLFSIIFFSLFLLSKRRVPNAEWIRGIFDCFFFRNPKKSNSFFLNHTKKSNDVTVNCSAFQRNNFFCDLLFLLFIF